MEILTCLVCVFCAALGYDLYRNILNPQTLFCGFLGVISFLASIRLFGLTETSDLVYLMIVLGVIAYTIGVTLSNKYRITVGDANLFDNKNGIFELREKFVFILVLILLLWSGYRMVTTVIPILRRGNSLDAVRLVYFGVDYQGYSYSRFDTILEMFVNLPFLYAMMPITAIELTKSKEERELNPITVVMMLIWIVLSCIISGGRLMIYTFIVLFIVSFLFNRKRRVTSKRIRHRMRNTVVGFGIIVVMIYIMYQLSINRTDSGTYEFLYQIYIYFCGCMPHTSFRLKTVNITYTYGLTFISGLIRPIMLVYKYLIGHGNFPDLYQRTIDIGEILQSPVIISSNHTFNAFVVPFYYFYYDGGIIAVIIESIIYGFFSGHTYFKYQRSLNKRDMAKYLVVVNYIATSMVRFSPSLVYFIFAYFYVDLCFKRTHEGIGKETSEI